jgi:DNA-binding PadR family transcriptional regulator
MDYTDEQYALMEKLENGLIYDSLTETEKQLLWYLDAHGIAQPRVQKADGYYDLSEDGKRILADHRQKVLAAKIQVRRELDELRERESTRQENERKENEKQKAAEKKEQERVNREQSCKEAERKAEHAFQYKLSLFNAFLTFISGLITGAILSNLDRLIPRIISLFS